MNFDSDQHKTKMPGDDIVPPLQEVSESGNKFFLTSYDTVGLYSFIVFSARDLDEKSSTISKLKRIRNIDPFADDEFSKLMDEPASQEHINFVLRNDQSLFEMMHCRFVDNFETYLTDIIREAIVSKPQMLKSKEQVSMEFLLQYPTMEELKIALIEQKVNELSYTGFADLEKWFNDRMGLLLLDDQSSLNELIEIIETRNLIVHNRARLNEKYLRKTGQSKGLGTKRKMSLEYFYGTFVALHQCVFSLDGRVIEKFGLETFAFPKGI